MGADRIGDLGVVIVTHTEPRLAAACIHSLANVVPRERIVAVVNDPASCDTEDLEALAKLAVTVSPPAPCGYAENVELGIAHLGDASAFVLVSNDDVEYAAGTPAALVSALRANPDAAVTAPRIADAEGRATVSWHRFPSLASEIATYLLGPASLGRALQPPLTLPESGVSRVDWALGAALLLRRSAFEEVGGFDTGYRLYSEEIDLCRRLADAGWTTLVRNDASARHLGGQSTGGGGLWQVGAESRHRYLATHMSTARRAALWIAIWPIDLVNLACAGAAAFRSPSRARTLLGSARHHHRMMRIAWRLNR